MYCTFFENGTQIKIPSEVWPPLLKTTSKRVVGIAWQTSQHVRTPNTLVIDPKEVLYSRSRASFSGVSISWERLLLLLLKISKKKCIGWVDGTRAVGMFKNLGGKAVIK